MPIAGRTVQARKKALATLVVERLLALGHDAQLRTNHTNSAGHRDLVVVDSSIGIIHVTASGSTDPNATVPVADYVEGRQGFLADKAYVAFGWNTKDGRTLIMFVRASDIEGKTTLTKSEIKRLSVEESTLGAA